MLWQERPHGLHFTDHLVLHDEIRIRDPDFDALVGDGYRMFGLNRDAFSVQLLKQCFGVDILQGPVAQISVNLKAAPMIFSVRFQ